MIEIASISETEVYADDSSGVEVAEELKLPEIPATEEIENGLELRKPLPEEEPEKEPSALDLVMERFGGTAEDWHREDIEGPETFFRDGEIFYADGRSLTGEIREYGDEFAIARHEEMLQSLESQSPYVFDGTLESTHYGMVVRADGEGRLVYENFSHTIKEAKETISPEDEALEEKFPEMEDISEGYWNLENAEAAEEIIISMDDALETETAVAVADIKAEVNISPGIDILIPSVAASVAKKEDVAGEIAIESTDVIPVSYAELEKSADAVPAAEVVSENIVETITAETELARSGSYIKGQIESPKELQTEAEKAEKAEKAYASPLYPPEATDKTLNMPLAAEVNNGREQEMAVVQETSPVAAETEEKTADIPQEEKLVFVREKGDAPIAEKTAPVNAAREKVETYVRSSSDILEAYNDTFEKGRNNFIEVPVAVENLEEMETVVPEGRIREPEHEHAEVRTERSVAVENIKSEHKTDPRPEKAMAVDKKEENVRAAETKTASAISKTEVKRQASSAEKTLKNEAVREVQENKVEEDKAEKSEAGFETPHSARTEATEKQEVSDPVRGERIRLDAVQSDVGHHKEKLSHVEHSRAGEVKMGPAAILRFMGVPERTAVAPNAEIVRSAAGRSYSPAGTAFSDDKAELWRERDEESGITILRTAA